MMAASLMTTACSNEDSANESPAQQSTVKTIPYSVTVSDGAETRATVDSDNKTLKFADGDKLYVTGTNIKGVLDIQTGATTASATFSGDLTYSGEGSPADDLALTATLVSAQQTVGTQVSVDDAGAVTVNYPTTAYCTSVNDAVQKYSNLTGTSTYSAKSFTLTQQTAFLNFEITVTGGVTGTTLPARFINNGATIKANVTTVTDGGVKAKFVLPVAKGTALSSATVKLGGMEITSAISNTTLSTGKVYNVKRTVDMSSVTLANTLNNADMTVKVKYNYWNEDSYCLFVSNGDGTYTFQSGGGYGPNHLGKALVVEDGKLVFKQNAYPNIATYWNYYGYSVTFDTSNNTYSQWAGGDAKKEYNPSFISVEVNGTEITVTETNNKITFEDFTKTEGDIWIDIVENNSDKIYMDMDDESIKRLSDDAVLMQKPTWGDDWEPVNIYGGLYDPSMYNYKFEGDD